MYRADSESRTGTHIILKDQQKKSSGKKQNTRKNKCKVLHSGCSNQCHTPERVAPKWSLEKDLAVVGKENIPWRRQSSSRTCRGFEMILQLYSTLWRSQLKLCNKFWVVHREAYESMCAGKNTKKYQKTEDRQK